MNTKSEVTTRIVLFLSFLFFATTVFSQKESVVYIGTNGKLTTPDRAIFMQKILTKSPRASVVQTFRLNDSKWEKIGSEQYKKLNDSTYQIKGNGENIPKKYSRAFIMQADRLWKFRDVVKGQIVRSGFAKSVVPLLVQGQVIEYYQGGNKKSVSEYNNNELVSNVNWNENGDKIIDDIFYSVDVYPTFNPGMKVLHQHILKGFKDAAIDIASISGSLILGFVVMENGTIDGIKIIKGLGPTINGVAYGSFATLKRTWAPAKLNDKTVRYFQIFPINFIYKQYQFEFAEMRGAILHFGAY